MARLHADTQRADRSGDQHFAGSGFARFARDFHAAAVEFLHFIAEAERLQLEAIRAEGIGLDDLRTGLDVGLVHAEDRFRLDGIHFVEAALRADGFVQQRAHRAIGDEDGMFQALVEIVDLQICRILSSRYASGNRLLSVFVP